MTHGPGVGGGWAQLVAVLESDEPGAKAALGLASAGDRLDLADWRGPPERPGRPPKPVLVRPQQTPRRRLGSLKGRIALLHALAHIEFNAIDLAFDMAVRFVPAIADLGLDWRAFVTDWTSVGREEAKHFNALSCRLKELGAAYGDLPAHDGLWETAERTRDDVLARLALAPLVLEARGLDVTPKLIADLKAAGDLESSRLMEMIYADEIGHVRVGAGWFIDVASRQNLDPRNAFRSLVADRFAGELKPPFNDSARDLAGFRRDFYDPPPIRRIGSQAAQINELKKRMVTSSHNSCATPPDAVRMGS